MSYIAALALILSLLSPPCALSFDSKATHLIVVEDTTRTELLAKAENETMFPASMTKLMTLYLLFEKLKEGGIDLNSTFSVSEKAWKKGGSKMFVEVGTEVRVEDLIRGIIVQSGNDACIVVAEALAGSEDAFAEQMTQKAKALGMSHSQFRNSTGWPDPEHFTSAHDLERLTHRLVHDFPDYYPYFAEREFTYSGITQPNRNGLLDDGIGVDGLKTGHTEDAGYGITVSALSEDGRRRVNVVVGGLSSMAEREAEAKRLVQMAFRDYEPRTLALPNQAVARLAVWGGAEDSVMLKISEALNVTLPRNLSDIRFFLIAPKIASAPVAAGDKLATLEVRHNDEVLKTIPLFAAQPVTTATLWQRFWRNLRWLSAGEAT